MVLALPSGSLQVFLVLMCWTVTLAKPHMMWQQRLTKVQLQNFDKQAEAPAFFVCLFVFLLSDVSEACYWSILDLKAKNQRSWFISWEAKPQESVIYLLNWNSAVQCPWKHILLQWYVKSDSDSFGEFWKTWWAKKSEITSVPKQWTGQYGSMTYSTARNQVFGFSVFTAGLSLVAVFVTLIGLCVPAIFIQIKLGGYLQKGIVGIFSMFFPIWKGECCLLLWNWCLCACGSLELLSLKLMFSTVLNTEETSLYLLLRA